MSAYTKQRYSCDCTRILKDGAVVALIERLSNDQWVIIVDERRVSGAYASVAKAFRAWCARNSDGGEEGR